MIVFISACVNSVDDVIRHFNMRNHLVELGYEFTEGVGVYKGIEERCFAIVSRSEREMVSLARRYEQECILVIDSRKATMVYTNGRKEQVGKLRKTKHRPIGDFIKLDGSFYYVVKE